MIIQVCVGSSCHLKGTQELVRLFTEAVAQNHLEGDVTLAGSFCTGRCNREGVTVTVDEDVYTGLTPDGFRDFFQDKVMRKLKEEGTI